MFGYIIADFTTLSKSDKKRYKQNYCGLCHALRKQYGARARWLLNYDTAFLQLIYRALKADDCMKTCRCPYHLGKKQNCAAGDKTEYAADVTVLLTYLKFEDDIADNNSFFAKLLKRFYSNCFKKAKSKRPLLADKITAHLCALADAQKRDVSDPMIPAAIFGKLLGDVFGGELYEFGFKLGRFIYLCDAACDFKSDIKHGRYNPLIRLRRSEIQGLLIDVMHECTDEYMALDIASDRNIIENILFSGVWLKYNIKTYKRKNK